jgi:drug/metabolite transporter (DMT)-like permease
MTPARIPLVASALVLLVGVFWGLYWLPVREIEARGLAGAWGTVAITLATAVVMAPVALRRRRDLRAAHPLALASIALGGAAFALYSIGFVYGRVALVTLLWFLSPVWAVLVTRVLLGWPTPWLRLVAVAVGVAGLVLMLGAGGRMPLPKDLGEWMSLVGGILWAFSITGTRVKSTLSAAPSTFVFALGAAALSLVLAPLLAPFPRLPEGSLPSVLALSFATGAIWWGASIIGLVWATMRLDPARVAILLMSEVPIGAVTAAWLAGETLHPMEIIGGAMVLAAGLLEVWPATGATRPTGSARRPPEASGR